MPVVRCLHHLDQPFLGLVAEPLAAAGVTVDESSELSLEGVDGVISFGGAQSAVSPSESLAAEIAFLRSAVDAGVPVLGICLGGQLLSAALGGTVSRAARRSVEWRSLSVVVSDPLFGPVGTSVPALHWNEDVFSLPPGAVSLLSPCVDGVEAFRFGSSAWGVQFHPEVDGAALDGWYASYGSWLSEAGVSSGVARARDRRWLPLQAAFSAELFFRFGSVVASGAGLTAAMRE